MKKSVGMSKPKSRSIVSRLAVLPTSAADLILLVVQAVRSFIKTASEQEVKTLLGRGDDVAKTIRKVLRELDGVNVIDDPTDPKAKWRSFYQKHFTINCDFDNLVIPAKPTDGNWTLIIVIARLTLNQIYHACTKQFACWRYRDDLDGNIKDIATHPEGTYAIWVEADKEAPKKYANKSANDLQAENHRGVTVKEQLLLQLDYFDTHKDEADERNRHMDSENITRCDGSRDSDGRVPDVDWHVDNRELYVYWYYADNRYDCLRSRSVSF